MSSRIFLVSCVASKVSQETAAAKLYTSPWFRKARTLVEATGDPWFILSAEHGMISPDTLVHPYERTLNKMQNAERREWAKRVQDQMESTLPPASTVIVLAGSRYRENLMPYLEARFEEVVAPMEGLSIGRQLNWLNNATAF